MIHGVRVVLRPVEERDHPTIHAWRNDPDVWWSMDDQASLSIEDVAERERRAREEGHAFVIEGDGRAIGRIALHACRRRDRICSLSVSIGDPDAWDRGDATDAIAALVDEAFDRMDLHRIEAWSLADDAQAIAAYDACGFAQDARLPERSWRGGAWVDHSVMSVTREGFAASPAAASLPARRGV